MITTSTAVIGLSFAFMTSITRLSTAIISALLLAGCSAVKLGYQALPDLGYWWLDGYVSFNDTQSARVKEDLRRLHSWHRQQELPRIAELLARLEQMAPGPITGPQVCAFIPEFQARFWATVDQAEPAVTALVPGLSPRQLREVQRKQAESNAKWRKDWLDVSAQDLKEKRFQQVLDRLEMIYGRLDEPQKAVLRSAIERSVFDPHRILHERQRRQQDLQQVMHKVATPQLPQAEVRAAVRGYLERSLQSPDPVHRAYQQALMDEGCRTAAAVHEATTAAQRESAVKRLRGYQRDLRDLAAAPA
jgi:hypothetical protein